MHCSLTDEPIQFMRVPVTAVRHAFLIPATAAIPYRVYRNHGITAQLSPLPCHSLVLSATVPECQKLKMVG